MNLFINKIINLLESEISLPPDKIGALLEQPPDNKMGDYALPCFSIAKQLRKNPQDIAAELSQKLVPNDTIVQITATGPYLNFHVAKPLLFRTVLEEIASTGASYGNSLIGKDKTIIIDYSSPNIAKHLAVHHLRSAVIGNAIYNLFKALGYRCIGINHLGDWGTQFGQLIVALKRWGSNFAITSKRNSFEEDSTKQETLTVNKLNELYVTFHKEAKTDKNLEEEAREWFKKLEDGDNEAKETWQHFKEISMLEFDRVYKRLGITFDSYAGESFYNEMLDDTVKRIKDSGLTEISEDALVVNLEKFNMPPCILRKRDEASLYATRDICAAEYRKREYHFDKMVYVVGSEQRLHFRQFFKVLEQMGYEWVDTCAHADFGLVKFKQGKMSTREGKVILLEDLLEESYKIAREIIEEKNPDLENREEVAENVGIGAIIFSELCTKRVKDVLFDWDVILNFDGETGPYVQYTHARMCSILRKYGESVTTSVDYNLLKEDDEIVLIKQLEGFPFAISRAADNYEPSILSNHLLDLCSTFNRYYQHHRILTDDNELRKARILLIDAIRQVIQNGLSILGLKSPERM
ncbi:MAG: arginine--tRNA ligase [Candidatus Scalindua sp. AMX11]|nr:MAG: arginine--tRNA ligase [Candidatus Scalindua sp.]NOG85654.1 arginine--tRNA ligase [Planctomycetota bacterium]RZV82486.1 MAG: arginine--tRNA ligase [Candidatus Scalindua sp. SCAELEC01]TDE65672.1 MAG: arginine--tRNA ligase [Candidatus Scalindua sp. AMX11]